MKIRTSINTAGLITSVAVTIMFAANIAVAQSISNSGSVSQVVAPGPFTTSLGELSIGGIGGAGTVTVDGDGTPGGALLTINENGVVDPVVRVGTDNGEGLLNIQNGGQLEIRNLTGPDARLEISNVFPDAATQDGTVNLSGAGSRIDIVGGSDNALVFVGRGGLGNFNISGGATLNVDAQNGDAGIQLGSSGGAILQPDAEGQMTVDGSNVIVTSNGGDAFLNVGRQGGGGLSNVSTLNVQNGSSIDLNGQSGGTSVLNIGRDGAAGIVTVSGGSTIDADDFISIGRGGNGTGTLNVIGGGDVDNSVGVGLARLGRNSSEGSLNVSGSGSLFTTKQLQIGADASGSGTVNVSDSGQLAAGSRIQVGRSGNGTLNIGDNPATGAVETGGAASSTLLTVGVFAGSTGTVNVTSAGGLNLLGSDGGGNGALLQVGREGTGVVNVSGGTVLIDDQGTSTANPSGILLGGTGTGTQGIADGTLNIGAGGTVTALNGITQVGRDAAGTLNITGGGVLDAANQTVSAVGRKTGATGAATVSGAGSTWNAGQNLFIGTDVDFGTQTAIGNGGTGTVTVAAGGTINSGNIVVDGGGTLTGSGGTINGNVTIQNGGLFAPGSSPGTMIINGDLIIDTGVLELETEGGISDQIDVSGTVSIGANAIVNLVFDVLPSVPVDIDSFFTDALPSYDPGFDGTGIFAFVTNPAQVGLAIDVFFGGGQSPLSITAQLSQAAAVSAPGAVLCLLMGTVVMAARRRRIVR